jgi:hypothetical protein
MYRQRNWLKSFSYTSNVLLTNSMFQKTVGDRKNDLQSNEDRQNSVKDWRERTVTDNVHWHRQTSCQECQKSNHLPVNKARSGDILLSVSLFV